jgi:molybdopterin synthase catalytic subunit
MSELHTADLRVAITRRPIDIGALYAEVADPGAGAVLAFLGSVRAHKQGRRVLRIDYEAYESMALRVLQRLGQEMLSRWSARRVVLVHRVGRLEVGDVSVALVLSTPHRDQGFEALRYGIESLKKDAPIWKKEHFEDGEVWVQEGS